MFFVFFLFFFLESGCVIKAPCVPVNMSVPYICMEQWLPGQREQMSTGNFECRSSQWMQNSRDNFAEPTDKVRAWRSWQIHTKPQAKMGSHCDNVLKD